ncbi:PEP-CTERM sorting domain-containing protein [Pontiellaceae bacterium B12227]|nr:PEP-CTERM sorting domain-containing protein [Pontiellaceae bacterium B12227]
MVMKKMGWRKWSALAVVVFGCATVEAVLFDFNDTTEFDNPAADGASMTRDGLTMTTVDLIGQDGTSNVDDDATHRLNIQTSVNSLGVNDDSNPQGAGNDSRDFDPNEAWVFDFDDDVTLEEIDLASMGEGTFMTMSTNGVVLFTFDDSQTGDIWDLGSTFIPSGTDIMIQNTSLLTATDTTARISELTVIPEPGTLGLLSACAVGVFMVRRFRV